MKILAWLLLLVALPVHAAVPTPQEVKAAWRSADTTLLDRHGEILATVRVDMAGRRASQMRNSVRVTNTDVIMEATIPMISVIAKPFTGPVPNWKRNSAVSTMQTLESTMAFIAWRNPSSMARRTVFPWISSSRIRSKISTLLSTVRPIDSTMPASPGRVSVASNMESPPRVNRR